MSQILKKLDKANTSHLIFTVGIFFFLYVFILTYNIPYFWEDILFLEGAYSQQTKVLIGQTFTFGTQNFSHPGIPLTLLLLNAITYVTGESAILFRLVRSLFFAEIVVMFFLLLRKLSISKAHAFLMTIVVGFSYPFFLTAFFIPRPEIFGIFWEYCGLIVFFHIFLEGGTLSRKGFYTYQFLCFIFLFIAMKMFSPAYFITPVLFFFILVMNYKRILQFIPLLGLLTAVYFPLNTELIHGSVGTYTVSTNSFTYMFSLSPVDSFFSFNNLYYKTVPEIFTPFGLILVIFAMIVVCYLLFMKITTRKKEMDEGGLWKNEKEKAFVTFMILMVLFNSIFIFATPDPATRYMVFFIMPLLSLILFFVFKGFEIFQLMPKKGIALILLFVCIIVFYNIALSVLFRFTWGSAFIGMDKVSSFIERLPDERNSLFYYSGTPADEYSPLILLNGKFVEKNHTIIYEKYWQLPVNIESMVAAKEYGNVYIVKRESSFGGTSYPSYNFTEPGFVLITTIKGENSLIDTIFFKIMKLVGTSYDFNTFYVYKWNSEP